MIHMLKKTALHYLSWLALSTMLMLLFAFTGGPIPQLDINIRPFYFVLGMETIYMFLFLLLLICIGLQAPAGESMPRFMRFSFLPLNASVFIQLLLFVLFAGKHKPAYSYDLRAVNWFQLQVNMLMYTFGLLLAASLLLALVYTLTRLFRRG